MSILNTIRDRITRPLFDPGFSKATFRIDRAVALHLVPIIEQLAPGDQEAWVQLNAIRPFFLGERPIVEIFKGDEIWVRIEGPIYTCGGIDFPLGGMVMADKVGWLNIGPVETIELLKRIRKAIDEAAFRWLSENAKIGQARSPRERRNRPIDDEVAFRQMAAAAGSIHREGEPSNA